LLKTDCGGFGRSDPDRHIPAPFLLVQDQDGRVLGLLETDPDHVDLTHVAPHCLRLSTVSSVTPNRYSANGAGPGWRPGTFRIRARGGPPPSRASNAAPPT